MTRTALPGSTVETGIDRSGVRSAAAMTVERFDPAQPGAEQRWDAFAENGWNFGLMHTRRFLTYHGDRFQDQSLWIRSNDGALLGVLPAATDPGDPETVTSHPGATYGGIVHGGALIGEQMMAAIGTCAEHYRQRGFRRLRYKAIPYVYHRIPAADDLYAFFRFGARCYRRDLSATIALDQPPKLHERRRRGLKRAERAGIRLEWGFDALDRYWEVLSERLSERHHVQPTHTLAEIRLLIDRFPQLIECCYASVGGRLEAGVITFGAPSCSHAQYITSSERGFETSALEPVFESVIARARQQGMRYFDFGNCNEDQGRYLNQGLYKYKIEYGAGGMVYEAYELAFDSDAPGALAP
jgi:hypothetical protein